MTEVPISAFARGMAWFMVALSGLPLVSGAYRHGLSIEVHHRLWVDSRL
jgi:hypothetical protein